MSEEKKDGGPAFPQQAKRFHDPESFGLSKREWFAGMALQGILSHACEKWCDHLFDDGEATKAAAMAFKMADAMLLQEQVRLQQGDK